MLTAKKRAFIDYYKLHRNATEAAKLAGYSLQTATTQGHRLIRDVDIKQAIEAWEATEKEKVANAIPSKQSYLVQTFIKAKEVEHAPTAAKYWEIGGKASGYLADEKSSSGDNITVICRELRLSLSAPPPNTDLIINQNDMTNNQERAEQNGTKA